MKRSHILSYFKIALKLLCEISLNLCGLFIFAGLVCKRSNQRRRVVFQAFSPHLAQFFQPVIEALRATNPSIEISFIVLIHPQLPLRNAVRLKRYAHRVLGIPKHRIYYFWEALWRPYDVLICSDVYARFPFRVSKKIILYHGICVSLRDIAYSPFRKILSDFDLVLIGSQNDCRLVTEYCGGVKRVPSMIATGIPFFDRFNDLPVSKKRYFERLKLNRSQPTVLIAPHWTHLGKFYFEQVLNVLEDLEINIIIKLHAAAWNKEMAAGFDWSGKLSEIEKRGRAKVDRAVDDLPAMAYSDLLITTLASSRSFVFMMLDKPVILYPGFEAATDQVSFKRFRLMRRGGYPASSTEDIRRHIITGQWKKKNPAREKVAAVCCDNFGNATGKVVQVIQDFIGPEGDFFSRRS